MVSEFGLFFFLKGQYLSRSSSVSFVSFLSAKNKQTPAAKNNSTGSFGHSHSHSLSVTLKD